MALRDELQIKIALTELHGKVLDTFLLEDLRPEICIEGPELRYFDRDACRRLANVFRYRGLKTTFHAPFMRLDPGSNDTPSRDYARANFERTLKVAQYFEPLAVVCHAGPLYHLSGADYARWVERSLPVFQWMAQACADAGTVLTLENVLHDRPGAMAPYFQELDQARWCFDVGHMHAFSAVDETSWTEELGHRLGQLHLHDNFGTGDQHLPAGHGSVDFRALMARLGQLPRPLAATLEVHYRHEFASSVEFLAPIWPWAMDY